MKYTTPTGIIRFCALNTPLTNYNPDGEYSVKLALANNEQSTKDFLADMAAIWEKLVQEQTADLKPVLKRTLTKVQPWADELAEDTAEPTGYKVMTFRMPAKVTSKKHGQTYTFEPAIFDARGEPVPFGTVRIGSGSLVRVAFTVRGYYMPAGNKTGMSVRLHAVQIIKLVSWRSQQSAATCGFEPVEGYEFEAAESQGGDETDF